VKFTNVATRKIHEMAASQNLEDYGLRVAVLGGGCSGFTYDMDFGQAHDNDYVQEFNNLKVIVDPMSFQYLEGTVIDYIESFQFSGFNFENPNAKNTCGCGSSFAV
jgi:iron-sulfur cluster assembly accessory protein